MATATNTKNTKAISTSSEAAVLLQNARQTQAELRRQIELAQQRIDALEEQIHGVQDELQREETALEELRGEQLRLDHEVDEVTLSVRLLAGSFVGGQTEQRLKELTARREAMATRIHEREEPLAAQRERAEQQIADIRARQQQEQTAIDECQRTLDQLTQQEQQAHEQHGRELWEQITHDIAEYEAHLNALKTELGETRQALYAMKDDARSKLADYPEYAEQLNEIAPPERIPGYEERLLKSYEQFLNTFADLRGLLQNIVPGAPWVPSLTESLELTGRQINLMLATGDEGRRELNTRLSTVQSQLFEWAKYADRNNRSHRR